MQQKRRNHVLCVDDDAEACQVLSTTLPLLNFTFAHSFAAGFQLIRSPVFDLYLLDEWLPDPSGVELCRQIRKFDANTPVVILSPAGYPGHPDAALEAGATAYLDMPADFVRLESTVIGLIQQAEVRSLNARAAEAAALRDEINQHLAEIDARLKENAEIAMRAIDHLLRARAYVAFSDSGGARSHFEKLWREVLADPWERKGKMVQDGPT